MPLAAASPAGRRGRGVHRALIEHVRAHIFAGEHDLARLRRNTRSAGKKALALLEHGLGSYGIDV